MRWTLITGGAKRLGKALCEHFAKKGRSLLIHYRQSETEAKELMLRCRDLGAPAEIVQGDFSTLDSTMQFAKDILARFPNVEHLVNNVGTYFVGSALKTPLNAWEEVLSTNLNAPFILSTAFAPSIINAKGTIINIGIAGLSSLRADTYSTAYMIAKTGLLQLTRSLAKELAPHQVRVNMVSPGYLETAVDLPKDFGKIPMGRTTTLQEVVNVVDFLMNSPSITGQNIEVAGGIRL